MNGEIRVYETRPQDGGPLTVTVELAGWSAQHYTSMPQNEDFKSLIANQIGLAVSEFLRKSSEGGG